MIDIKLIRENPELIRSSQRGRGEDETVVDRLLELDTKRRDAIANFEALRAEQNLLSKSVGATKGDEKNTLLEQAKTLAAKVKEGNFVEVPLSVKKRLTELGRGEEEWLNLK